MLRPIQVAPLSQQRLISQNPLVPNNMTQEEVLRNAMATPGSAPLTPNMAARPLLGPAQTPAPTAADLGAVGQAGLQSAERISKSVTRSPGVQGLLGGGQSAAGLLGDISGQADLQGLFATLSAMGRPVARGESRLLGAVEYGQQARQQAREQGLQDMSTQMRLEEMSRKRAMDQARLDAVKASQDRIQGAAGQVGVMEAEAAQTAQTPELTTFSAYQVSQMDPNQLSLAKQSEVLSQEADALALVAPEQAQQFRDQASQLREQAAGGLMTRKDAVPREESLRKEFSTNYVEETNDIVQRRNTLVELLQQGGPVSKYLTFVSAIKTVEPTSAVLSSEYESAQALSGLLARLEVALDGIKGDQPLPEQFRKDMENVGNLMAEAAMEHYNKGAEQYRGIATRSNLNPDNVIIQPTPIRDTSAMTTETGAVENPASAARSIRGGRTGAVR